MKRLLLLFFSFIIIFTVNSRVSLAQEQLVTSNSKIDNELLAAMENTTHELQVIVTFKGETAPTENQLNILETLGIETGISMKSLPIAGVLATKSQILSLANNPEVHSLYLNKKLDYYNYDSTALTGVDKLRTDSAIQKANGGLPITGKGIGVVINDSGIDGLHQDHAFGKNLVQNVMGSTNLAALAPGLLPITYVENVPNTDTNSGHGTHVAGTVGGTGAMSGGKYEGVAPGANLIGYGSGAALFILDGIGGFDYAITNQTHYNIRVITNSWGSSGDFDPNHPINLASKKAYDRGITVLFAAGNEGPGENTHNPYAKAPWVISVGAGEKDGTLADFSSRGTKGIGGTFEMDGKTWTWKDEPTIVAPGVDIVSTRALAPVSSLALTDDAAVIEPGFLPYYTLMSGTSMATPHVAGIVALLLEADPTLAPSEIKKILQDTATNMPGYETWEVGAGYVNAYASLDAVLFGTDYGSTVNAFQTFNSHVETTNNQASFEVSYNPVSLTSNSTTFKVETGTSQLVAKINAAGILGLTGNMLNLVLIAPDGTEFSSGVSLLFPLNYDRTVSVNSPLVGEWKAEIRGLRGAEQNPIATALPETVTGTITFSKVTGFTGLSDIQGHPASEAIKQAVNEKLVDGYNNGNFKPDKYLTRKELATYLTMGTGVRQSKSTGTITDVSSSDIPYVQAVIAKGAAIRDHSHINQGIMLLKADGTFNPNGEVTRAELAYSLVQALGLQEVANNFSGELTVQYNDQRIAIQDATTIPNHLKGYVQIALDLNILNASFSIVQGPYDLEPTIEATFSPMKKVSRGEYAVAATRYYNAYLK